MQLIGGQLGKENVSSVGAGEVWYHRKREGGYTRRTVGVVCGWGGEELMEKRWRAKE
jgi:hypothetical protein